MRAVVQRVADCSVQAGDEITGAISSGLLVYLGVSRDDTEDDAEYLAKKIVHLRIFEDENGKMNRSLSDFTDMEIIVVSQFTLYGDGRKGRRPSFSTAAPPEHGEKLYTYFLKELAALGFTPRHGSFGAFMQVKYVNLGPMTLLLDSTKLF